MKTALVTTTIRVPEVLRLYRELGPDVVFFVAGDEKTPHNEVARLCEATGNCWAYFTPEDQRKLGYQCCELIGWNSDARRNIAILEAIKRGAEAIVTIDDDNLPLGPYFGEIERLFYLRFCGIKVTPTASPGIASTGQDGRERPGAWFDQGQLLVPPAKQRGAPFGTYHWRADPITNARIGVVAGTCLGDPDIDAATRITTSPEIHQASELLHSGVVANPDSFFVFNSQNTAFLRELAPAMFILPGSGTTSFIGRNADIFASCIMRRVMRDRNLHCHFGKPFVWQTRNPHNLLRDMRSEQLALERVDEFARMVDRFPENSDPLLPWLGQLYQSLRTVDWWDESASDAAMAWIDDCRHVL